MAIKFKSKSLSTIRLGDGCSELNCEPDADDIQITVPYEFSMDPGSYPGFITRIPTRFDRVETHKRPAYISAREIVI